VETVLDLPSARILALLHSALGLTSFFILLPLALLVRKGSLTHRRIGIGYIVCSALFYVSGEAIPLNKIIAIPEFPKLLFALVTCVNVIGFILILLGYTALRPARFITLHKRALVALMVLSVALILLTFMVPYKQHYVALGIITLVLIRRDVVALATRTATESPVARHSYYMLGAYLYAVLFLMLTMPVPVATKIWVAPMAMLPLIVLQLPSYVARFSTARRIPALLGLLLLLTYGCTLFAMYANMNALWCPKRALADSPACQMVYRFLN